MLIDCTCLFATYLRETIIWKNSVNLILNWTNLKMLKDHRSKNYCEKFAISKHHVYGQPRSAHLQVDSKLKNKQSDKKWPVNDVGVYTTNKVDGYPVTAIWHCTWSKYLWERFSVAACYGKILS